MFFAVLFKSAGVAFAVFVVVRIQSHSFMNRNDHNDSYGGNMAGSIMGVTKLSEPLQIAPIEYAGETRLIRLKQSDSWNFTSGSKRGRLEIMAEILCYCGEQKTKTNIMYKANLNYRQLKKHLRDLTSQGLLTACKNRYVTTQKGYRFLELFVALNDILSC